MYNSAKLVYSSDKGATKKVRKRIKPQKTLEEKFAMLKAQADAEIEALRYI